MDNPSFAEIKEKFNKMNVVPYPRPRAPSIDNESSSSAPSVPERLKTESSNQTFDSTNPTIFDPNASSSQVSNETSSSRDAILARIRQHGVNSVPSFKKPPVPLPHSVIQHRHESTSSESSSISQDPTLIRVFPPDVNTVIASKKPPVPLPNSVIQHRNESTSSESSSISQDPTLIRVFHPDVNTVIVPKKPPVPLPNSVIQHRNESTSSESSSVSQDPTLHRVFPPDVNTVVAPKKLPVPLPNSDQNENTYSELSNDLPDSTSSSNISQNATSYAGFRRPSIPLPISANIDRHESIHSEPLTVSLDAMLPSKCMFSEFETMINEYQRRDPRTIIYPKIKATMPQITTNEINTLQRYSST